MISAVVPIKRAAECEGLPDTIACLFQVVRFIESEVNPPPH